MISVYNRLTWSYNFVYRSSQHAVLSSNTLAELYNVIPCPSKDIPDESTVDGELVGYESGPSKHPSGHVVVIEGTAYGDGLTENDYARYVFLLSNANRTHGLLLYPSSKLIAHVSEPPTLGSKLHETPFSSLSLRLNHPYWLVHHGDCEHFLVVDQIRYVFSPHHICHLVDIFNLVYCTHTILLLGTRLPRKSRLRYMRTVAHVRKSRPCIQLSATCALVRARAFFAHLVGGTWACRKTKKLKLLWLSHSQSMNSVNLHHGAMFLPLRDLPNSLTYRRAAFVLYLRSSFLLSS